MQMNPSSHEPDGSGCTDRRSCSQIAYEIVHQCLFYEKSPERYVTQFLDYLSAKAKVDSEVADDVWEAAKKRALEKLEEIVRRLADKKPAIITSLSIGCPLEEITKFSAERDVDLIVMSTHRRTGLRRSYS